MPGPSNTQFAVAAHVLVYLAGVREGAAGGPPRPVSSDELAGSVNVSPVHIRRVLGPLRTAGLLVSRPGPAGGWVLARDPADLRFDEVWQLVHPAPAPAGHVPNPQCPVGRRVRGLLEDLQADVDAAVRDRLHGRTVADVVIEVGARPARR